MNCKPRYYLIYRHQPDHQPAKHQ